MVDKNKFNFLEYLNDNPLLKESGPNDYLQNIKSYIKDKQQYPKGNIKVLCALDSYRQRVYAIKQPTFTSLFDSNGNFLKNLKPDAKRKLGTPTAQFLNK